MSSLLGTSGAHRPMDQAHHHANINQPVTLLVILALVAIANANTAARSLCSVRARRFDQLSNAEFYKVMTGSVILVACALLLAARLLKNKRKESLGDS